MSSILKGLIGVMIAIFIVCTGIIPVSADMKVYDDSSAWTIHALNTDSMINQWSYSRTQEMWYVRFIDEKNPVSLNTEGMGKVMANIRYEDESFYDTYHNVYSNTFENKKRAMNIALIRTRLNRTQ